MKSKSQNQMPMRGVAYALLASFLFGLTTPFSKGLLSEIHPVLLAGLFYLGSGLGLSLYRVIWKAAVKAQRGQAKLTRSEKLYLAGAIASGGIFAPALLMLGLVSTPASTASLFLNTESVFTALMAWFWFKENYDARIFLGMLAITAGAAVLSIQGSAQFLPALGSLLILAACFSWGVDNNLTRKVANADAAQIASYKGLVAGLVNTTLALCLAATLPSWQQIGLALLIGLFGYGISLVLYVLALRHIGAARTGAYFAIAPFAGAIASLLFFHEAFSLQLLGAGALMALGLYLHLTEHHAHFHVHDELVHEHEHIHDEHHQHEHGPDDPPGEPHVHTHRHETLAHDHAHFPDLHHNHEH